MISKIVNILLFLGIVSLVYVFFLIFVPVNVIEVKNPQNLPILTPNVRVGEQILIKFDYTKHIDIRPSVRKEIRCQKSFELLIEPRQLPLGTHEVNLNHTIPLNMPTDKNCQIYIFLAYPVNFFRTEHYTFITDYFEVINPVFEE